MNNPGRVMAFYLFKTGEATSYELGNSNISPSPTRKYWVEMTDGEIKVFSSDHTRLKTIPLSAGMDHLGFEFTCRRDDSGFFLVGSEDIYTVDIAKSEINPA